MHRLIHTKKNHKGIALVMSLMILSVAMLTGLFMNSIILGELRVSLNTVNVVNSYYAAESGIEKALYYVNTDDIDYYDNLDTMAEPPALDNGASYSYVSTVVSAPNFVATNISNTNPAHVSIIDPTGDISSISWSSSDINSAYFRWKINNCFPAHASDRIETTIYSFSANFNSPDVQKIVSVCDCKSRDSVDSCTTVGMNISRNKYYKFSFRPLDNIVNNLSFEIAPGILSETLTKVKGKYKNSEYLLQAQMSALSPTSDIFSYVIFSEEDLIKD